MNTLFALIFYLGLVGIVIFAVLWIVTKVLKRKERARLFRNTLLATTGVTLICFIGYGLTNEQVADPVEDAKEDEVKAAAPENEAPKEAVEKVVEEPDTETYKVGDEAIINDISYTVTNVEAKDTVAGYTSESGTFLIVNISVKNNSKEAIRVNNSHFTLMLGDVEYDNHSNTTAYHEGGFFLVEVNPGLSTSNSVVFEVPKDYKDAALHIKPNQFEDGEVLVNLN